MLARGKLDPESSTLSKDMQREAGVHGGWPCRVSFSQGVTHRQEEHWALAAALSGCLALPPHSRCHLPGILRAPSGDQLHLLATRATGQGACASVPPESVSGPGGWVLLRLPCTAQQAKSRYSGSKTLNAQPFQQFQWPKAFPQACPTRQSLKLQSGPSFGQPQGQALTGLDLNNLNNILGPLSPH